MTAEAPHPPSCCIGSSSSASPLHNLSASINSLLFLWLLLSPAAHALPQGTNPAPGTSTSTSSDDENNNGDSDSSLTRDGLLNLYFLFIAIVVILLVVALLLLHRRKKRRKAMMRNYGQSALAQDINGHHHNNNTSRWLPGPGRWMMGGAGASGTHRAPEEGLNERGEAPPPYNQPPGGPPQPAYAPGASYVAMPPPPPPGWQSDAGLTIPMRTLSRDTQGNKPPDYQETLAGPGAEGGPPPPQMMTDNSVSANSSTGNLLRHGGPNQGETQR
ncbi:hypothetical protein DBV05_g11959 [Lasiodiplodia theobromae]|uniref:Uncharacterized protein n=1 Tax=Lasiodiplodia theobromae TaxID=45133 RepID=A0A5N5CVJ0_9PEZI|nr:hypothetical protein DBV05_g11959 [Lasiodiplodia theobromae]